MRLSKGCALLVLGAVLAAPALAALPSDPSRKTLEGDWETVIASPKRPWIFLVHLKPVAAGWTGTMSIRGLPDFPLRDIRAESTRIHFQFPPELDSLVFDGTLANGEIVGHVLEGGQKTPTRLTRVVPLPAPANRLEAWQQDLDFAGTHLAEYDRSFTPGARQAFRQALAQLKLDLPRKNDAEILVALSHAVALGDNAHTRLRLDPTRHGSFSTSFPIRMWWFSDGPYVVRTAPPYRRALRCRAVAIDGHELSEARDKVAGLFAGNPAWANYLSPIYLINPDILYGLGLIRSTRQASFTFEDPRGARFSISVRSEPVDRDAMAGESWQDLSPLVVAGKPPWATALAADPAALPLYLRHPQQPYWFEFLPETGLLYFQFNHSDNAREGPSLVAFGDSLLAFVRQHPIRDVVVDLRLNSGGNLDVAKGFMRSLAQEEKINRRGRLFVIIGHCTFSAGLYHAAQMKQFTQAIFVGEAIGDRLDFWAEGGEIELPNSHAIISYSNGFHRYSGVRYSERQPYYEELSIPSLAPDVPVPMSSKDYFSGRDPALEAIEARLRQ
jgi:hypothetical protein